MVPVRNACRPCGIAHRKHREKRMCGDLDEESGFEAALYARFRSHAQSLLSRGQPTDAKGVNAALERLFQDGMARAIRDQESVEESGRYELLAMQPLVFARLAGFLAAHASLQEDPLRKVLEALMHGYAEAERIEPYHGHDHDHEHHGHDHPH
jgi:hypothetical protein